MLRESVLIRDIEGISYSTLIVLLLLNKYTYENSRKSLIKKYILYSKLSANSSNYASALNFYEQSVLTISSPIPF